LWLGGAVSLKRDRRLADALMQAVRACARLGCAVLVCVDGWAAYPQAILRAFRDKLPRHGRRGRCRLQAWTGLGIARVIKHTRAAGHQVTQVTRAIVRGTAQFVAHQLCLSHGGIEINTAYIERLNATFRERLAVLTRRCRHVAKRTDALRAGMYLVGCVYNCCTPHHALRLPNFDPPDAPRWTIRTPAMAAVLTDHVWTVRELMTFKIAPPPYVPPTRRGRPPKRAIISDHQLVE